MSIKILYGPSGHGKTEYVYSDIVKEACANPNKKICIYSTGAVIFAGTEKGRKDAPLTWCF